MGSENLIPCGVGFIHPPRERDTLAKASTCLDAVLNGIVRHKRPSLWFRSFRVKLSPVRYFAPKSLRVVREFRSNLSETLTGPAATV
jgi:hypothetical protein